MENFLWCCRNFGSGIKDILLTVDCCFRLIIIGNSCQGVVRIFLIPKSQRDYNLDDWFCDWITFLSLPQRGKRRGNGGKEGGKGYFL